MSLSTGLISLPNWYIMEKQMKPNNFVPRPMLVVIVLRKSVIRIFKQQKWHA